MSDFGSLWCRFVYATVLLGGTLLVGLASLERVWGRPIPRLKYSRPVPKQRIFIVVPVTMIAVLIGSLMMLMPVGPCSQCPAPYAYPHPLLVAEFLVFAIGLAGGIGFALFVTVWIGCAIWRITAALHHRVRVDRTPDSN
jgi:hypothetical protein